VGKYEITSKIGHGANMGMGVEQEDMRVVESGSGWNKTENRRTTKRGYCIEGNASQSCILV
jgi:hypothetical protein